MNKSWILSLISQLRTEANCYIEQSLIEKGIDDLLVSHGNILVALYYNDGKLSMKEIACKINRTKSTVTQLVNRMEKAGYLKKEKSEEDARSTFVLLTDKAWEIKPVFDEISTNVISKLYEDFSEEEAEQLMNLLKKAKGNF